MNKKPLLILLIICLIVAAGVVWWSFQTKDSAAPSVPENQSPAQADDNNEPSESAQNQEIQLNSLKAYDEITSPLTITGQVRGTWFFEASFPIEIHDKNGNVIATSIAEAQSDWMTEDFVPFKTVFSFALPTSTEPGEIVFKKDNPSGLPEFDKEWRLPIILKVN